MSLHLPSEIVVEQVLPSLRVRLARKLAARDLTQDTIASHLGVTQAAVSQYLNDDTGLDERIDSHPRTHATTDRIADGFASGEMDSYDALAELLSLIQSFEDRGPICELHEEAVPELRGLGCDLCVRGGDDQVAVEREILANVRSAARTLATTENMAAHIPNVGTNVGYAKPDADDDIHVAAIPGRVYSMGGRVEVPANPEFGVSHHVATVILAASVADPTMRGAVNLSTSDQLLAAARDADLETMEFDAEYESRRERLQTRFEDRESVPQFVYHRGAFGIEPISYVLAEDAKRAAQLAGELVAGTGAVEN